MACTGGAVIVPTKQTFGHRVEPATPFQQPGVRVQQHLPHAVNTFEQILDMRHSENSPSAYTPRGRWRLSYNGHPVGSVARRYVGIQFTQSQSSLQGDYTRSKQKSRKIRSTIDRFFVPCDTRVARVNWSYGQLFEVIE
jgi:hypothetical protein